MESCAESVSNMCSISCIILHCPLSTLAKLIMQLVQFQCHLKTNTLPMTTDNPLSWIHAVTVNINIYESDAEKNLTRALMLILCKSSRLNLIWSLDLEKTTVAICR